MKRVRFPTLKITHWAIGKILRSLGYRWEEHRSGELRIGVWRKRLRKNPSDVAKTRKHPKRFVLIAGFGDTALSWAGTLTPLRFVLSSHYDEIVLFDYPGYSGSLHDHQAFHDMGLLLRASHDVLDSYRPHTILGHSLGAWIATSYAGECGRGERPQPRTLGYEGPEKVILADPSGAFPSEEDRDAWREKFRTAVEDGFDTFRPYVFSKEPFWFRFVAGEFSHFMAKQEIRDFMLSVDTDHEVEQLCPQVKGEVWLLWGEDDGLVPSNWMEHWMGLFREAKTRGVRLRRAGHSPHIEAPLTTAFVLGQILRGRSLRGEPGRVRRWELVESLRQ